MKLVIDVKNISFAGTPLEDSQKHSITKHGDVALAISGEIWQLPKILKDANPTLKVVRANFEHQVEQLGDGRWKLMLIIPRKQIKSENQIKVEVLLGTRVDFSAQTGTRSSERQVTRAVT